MSFFKHVNRSVFSAAGRQPAPRLHQYPRNASRVAARIPFTPPPFPVIESCPSPTCQCREMPEGLEIEREQSLSGSMASYAEQVLISTGQPDWKSKIEEEDNAVFLREMKNLLGPKGKYSDPYHNVMMTNSSYPPTSSDQPASKGDTIPASKPASKPGSDPNIVPQATFESAPASVFLLPSFQYVPSIPTDRSSIEAFIKAFILPSKLHASHDVLSRAQKNILLREPEMRKPFLGARKVDEILVLICGHGGRDQRCGTLGPILQAEFEEKLERQNIEILRDPPVLEAIEVNTAVEGYTPRARVGLISHIGGHKYAGNVIVYIPPSFTSNPLAGKGIWYGRIEPQHVEGVVSKTILDGKVIKDHFRGGISQGGEIMRL